MKKKAGFFISVTLIYISTDHAFFIGKIIKLGFPWCLNSDIVTNGVTKINMCFTRKNCHGLSVYPCTRIIRLSVYDKKKIVYCAPTTAAFTPHLADTFSVRLWKKYFKLRLSIYSQKISRYVQTLMNLE